MTRISGAPMSPASMALLHLCDGRIETAVETDPERHSKLLHLRQAFVDPRDVQINRLLAESRLAASGGSKDEIDMQGSSARR